MYAKIKEKLQPKSSSSTEQMLTFFSENAINTPELIRAELEEREKALREIEEQIVGINELFTNVANLVNEQAPLVDSIELSIEKAKEETAKGAIELEKAEKYQPSLCFLM